VRTLTRYMVRLHLPVLFSTLALVILVVAAIALFRFLDLLGDGNLEVGELPVGSAVLAFVVRALLVALPPALLLATLSTSAGLRQRNETVALEACGYHAGYRLRVALALGLAGTLLSAGAQRSLVPQLRRVERDLKLAVALSRPEELIQLLYRSQGAWLGISVEEASGDSLLGLLVWRAPGLPEGTLIHAREADLDYDRAEQTLDLQLRGVHVLGEMSMEGLAEVEALELESLHVTLQLPGEPWNPRMSQCSVDELWELRPGFPEKIDEELSDRLARSFLCLAYALSGFVLGELLARQGRTRDLRPYVFALGVVVADYALRPVGKALSKGGFVPLWCGPWSAVAPILVCSSVIYGLAKRRGERA
jgi:lipopolysaccharide export LptBFGC system permease protein LptF